MCNWMWILTSQQRLENSHWSYLVITFVTLLFFYERFIATLHNSSTQQRTGLATTIHETVSSANYRTIRQLSVDIMRPAVAVEP